ncbi:MAG: deoxyribonuclease V [Chlorobiota bacterium]
MVGRHTAQWKVSVEEAIELQRQWARQVCRERQLPDTVSIVAGLDAAYDGKNIYGVAVSLRLPSLEVVESTITICPEEFPYIPGLLSFREAPALLGALQLLRIRPDVILCDGQGIAHPRRFGIASHIGVLADIPSIGCAKSLLCGQAEHPADTIGATAPVWDRGEVIAFALRTRSRARPVYVSIGHRVDLHSAVEVVLECCRGYRLPEPIRLADLLSKRLSQSTRRSHSAIEGAA